MPPLQEERISVKRAVSIVFLSMIVISALFFAASFYYKTMRRYSINNRENQVLAIASRSQTATKLSSQLLAELLHLSVDKPVNIYHFDCRARQELLKSFPVFASVSVKSCPPSVIFVDYRLRKPIFLVGDLDNIAIDDQGVLFPLEPFYPRLNIPDLYLGNSYSISAKKQLLDVAKDIQGFFLSMDRARDFQLTAIDLHAAQLPSSKEITLTLQGKSRYLLRLSATGWRDGLSRFFYLYTQLIAKGMLQNLSPKEDSMLSLVIVDLRLPKMAFVR